eukprot:TRINITY_DN3325_c3_g1_i1.p1 TRINITY_DN3325_c3_g1~~TRINITY_DN3325_c3_g1_i1.p1  ORF type:complete len:277 (+),score=44.39 TRINITY_DN3325_c3_g1_i1:54-884(+)
MRFRAQLRQVRTLVQVLSVLQKVNRYGETVWKIGARRLMFICGAGTGGSGVQTVVTIKSSQVMEEMRVESRMDNSIYLRVDAGALLRVLKPAEKATSATIKLGVVGGRPIIQICMAMKSNSSHDVIHDIPVAVLTEEEVGEMTVPDCTGIGNTTPSIFLPPVSELRPFLEKAVKMTDKVQVTASVSSATIELRIQTASVSSATRFHKLTVGKKDDEDVAPPTASCVVDAKKLLSIIDLDKLSPTQVLGHFLESRSLIIQVSGFEELSVVFVLPCLS